MACIALVCCKLPMTEQQQVPMAASKGGSGPHLHRQQQVQVRAIKFTSLAHQAQRCPRVLVQQTPQALTPDRSCAGRGCADLMLFVMCCQQLQCGCNRLMGDHIRSNAFARIDRLPITTAAGIPQQDPHGITEEQQPLKPRRDSSSSSSMPWAQSCLCSFLNVIDKVQPIQIENSAHSKRNSPSAATAAASCRQNSVAATVH